MIAICDVGPRDGLQNDPTLVAPETRAELARRLMAAGVARVEAVSFVRDERVPQMAGAEAVVAALRPDLAGVSGLVLNERGYDRAVSCGLREVHYALPVTDAFGERNQGTTVAGAA